MTAGQLSPVPEADTQMKTTVLTGVFFYVSKLKQKKTCTKRPCITSPLCLLFPFCLSFICLMVFFLIMHAFFYLLQRLYSVIVLSF